MLAPGNIDWNTYIEAPKIYRVEIDGECGVYNQYDIDFMINHFHPNEDFKITKHGELVYHANKYEVLVNKL